jgi:hypothetical protein
MDTMGTLITCDSRDLALKTDLNFGGAWPFISGISPSPQELAGLKGRYADLCSSISNILSELGSNFIFTTSTKSWLVDPVLPNFSCHDSDSIFHYFFQL